MVLRLYLGQISFNLVENAFETRPLAVLATKITFEELLARACAEIKISRFRGFWTKKWPTSLGFSIFVFCFPLSFFSFSFVFAAGIDLSLGFLAVKELLRKSHRGGQFLPWSS